jgi:hypothetical protein
MRQPDSQSQEPSPSPRPCPRIAQRPTFFLYPPIFLPDIDLSVSPALELGILTDGSLLPTMKPTMKPYMFSSSNLAPTIYSLIYNICTYIFHPHAFRPLRRPKTEDKTYSYVSNLSHKGKGEMSGVNSKSKFSPYPNPYHRGKCARTNREESVQPNRVSRCACARLGSRGRDATY